jgi:integrase
VLPNPKKISAPSHHAAMPYADLPACFAMLKASPDTAPRALAFVVLTAARSGEVLGATWDEIDLDPRC